MKLRNKLDGIIDAHQRYWTATSDYINALGALEVLAGETNEDTQRLRCMKTKIMADRCRIEFELNRLVEKNR